MMPIDEEFRLRSFLAACALGFFVSESAAFQSSGALEIHYINVGQGGSTLIIGPNGTRILYDFGNVSGNEYIVPYLRNQAGIAPSDGLHYAIVSHRDRDHYVGYRDVVKAGYDVWVANYGSGSGKESTMVDRYWLNPAQGTTAEAVRPIPIGARFALGDGAELVVVASDGRVWNDERVPVPNENDRSIALFITYNDFQYVLDGDLGAGPEECTRHDDMGQRDLQTRVADTLIDEGFLDPATGVDVMHVAHHGSESSTSAAYYNRVRPEVAIISVGHNQGSFLHPRTDVVDTVLLSDERPGCLNAPPVKCVFQTEDGVAGRSPTGTTSFSGLAVGNIVVKTDGRNGYRIIADGQVHEGESEADDASGRCGTYRGESDTANVWRFRFDENY